MNNILAVLAGTLMSAAWLIPGALAQTACVTQNMAIPAGANTSDKAAPLFIDTTGLNFKTAPPTRDPSNPKRGPRYDLFTALGRKVRLSFFGHRHPGPPS